MSYKNIECDKILLISDTHGDNETYKKIIKKNKPDVVLHAGDFYDSKSRDSFDLDSFKKVVNFYIEGNHGIKEKNIEYIKKVTDKKEGKTRRLFMYKKLIKDYEIVKLNGENFLLIHVFDDEKYNFFCDDEWFMYRLKLNRLIRKNKISYVVFGHSHKVEMVQYDKFLAINPGSLTAPENEGQGTYAIGLWDKKEKKFNFKIKTV